MNEEKKQHIEMGFKLVLQDGTQVTIFDIDNVNAQISINGEQRIVRWSIILAAIELIKSIYYHG